MIQKNDLNTARAAGIVSALLSTFEQIVEWNDLCRERVLDCLRDLQAVMEAAYQAKLRSFDQPTATHLQAQEKR